MQLRMMKNLKDNKDLDKFLENINIIEKDLVSIFEKNRIKKIEQKGKNLIQISIKQCLKLKMKIKIKDHYSS